MKGQLNFGHGIVVVDSYNSSDTNKSTDGQYDPAKAGDNGDIFSDELPGSSTFIGSAHIFGTYYSGPSLSFAYNSEAAVGSHAWQAAGNTGIEPGYLVWPTNFLVPDVILPDYSQYLGPTILGGQTLILLSPATNETFLGETNLPSLAPGQTIDVTTNIVVFETNEFPGAEPGLTTNVTWVTTNDYPGQVEDLVSNCTDFVTVTNDPGPQPCLSTNYVVTTSEYPGPMLGLVTNTSITITDPACISGVTNVTIITNSPCSGPVTSSTPPVPGSWCLDDGIQTNCTVITAALSLPAAGTQCPGSGIITNYAKAGHIITGYTYSLITNFTYTISLPSSYTTNEAVEYFTNNSCPGVTNYTFSFPNLGYAYATGVSYTYPLYTYSYQQTNYDYTIFTPAVYETNSYDHILCGNYFTTNELSGNTVVTGPSTLVLPGPFQVLGGTITIAPGGSLAVYVVNGGDATFLIGNHSFTPVTNLTGLPSDLQIYCSSSVSGLTLSGVGPFTGVLYAPSATITIITSHLDFSGEIVADSLYVNGGLVNFHYDEALGQLGFVGLSPPTLAANLIVASGATVPNAPFEFYVNGLSGTNYAVEISTDLINWNPVFTNVAPFEYDDTNIISPGQAFYRTVYIP